jgi:hypothetical protein
MHFGPAVVAATVRGGPDLLFPLYVQRAVGGRPGAPLYVPDTAVLASIRGCHDVKQLVGAGAGGPGSVKRIAPGVGISGRAAEAWVEFRSAATGPERSA